MVKHAYAITFMGLLVVVGIVVGSWATSTFVDTTEPYYRGAYYSCIWNRESVSINGKDIACEERVREMRKYGMDGFKGNFDLNAILNGAN